jgi:hypothetical protein
MSANQKITPEEILAIRRMGDFDLTMLISEIHDHGWPEARKLIPLIGKAEEVLRTREAEIDGLGVPRP